MEFTLNLTDEQFDQLADQVFKKLLKVNPDYGKRTRPYTVKEFMDATGKKASAVYADIKAGRIELVQDYKPYLIKASEVERFTK